MTPEDILPYELLERIRDRAAGYDRDNSFFHEDFRELADAGYLKLFVPESDGGRGLGLAEVAALQRRLAGAAPATALGVNMHLVWTGVARVLENMGDGSLSFVLKEAGEGEVFAFAISEAGNDSMLFDSGTVAARLPNGGYSFTGRKIFTSLSRYGPAWELSARTVPPAGAQGNSSSVSWTGRLRAIPRQGTGTPWACVPASPIRHCSREPWSLRNGSSGSFRPDPIRIP